MRRSRLAVAVLVLALASSAAAFAAHGYKIIADAQHRPTTGSVYSVRVRGQAAAKALVYVYLDNQPCQTSWAKEDSLNVSAFQAGQSHFESSGTNLLKVLVNGHFDTSYNARAGTTAQTEYECAYLTTPHTGAAYRNTAAHASSKYFVMG